MDILDEADLLHRAALAVFPVIVARRLPQVDDTGYGQEQQEEWANEAYSIAQSFLCEGKDWRDWLRGAKESCK